MRTARVGARGIAALVLAVMLSACGSPHATGALGSWQDFDEHINSSTSELSGLLGDPTSSSSPNYFDLADWADRELAWLKDHEADPCYAKAQESWFYEVNGFSQIMDQVTSSAVARTSVLATLLNRMRDRIKWVKSDIATARGVCAGPQGSASGT